jgi:hypothetical protein
MPLLPTRQPRHVPESSGQPEAAGVDAGPLEGAEELRGERDDVIRGLMAALARVGRDEGIPEDQLEGYGMPEKEREDGGLKLYRLLSGHYRHHLTAVGVVKAEAGQQIVPFVEEVDAGFIFIARGLRVLGPEGTKLLLYENNTVPTSFREVVTNVQQFSGEPPGTCLWRGPCRLLAVTEEVKKEGQLTVRLEGDLVPEEYLPRV